MPAMDEFAILVVDDDESTVKSIRRTLRRKGFSRIISALNGDQGIKLLERASHHFFLIISDCRMPGMEGAAFLEKSILLSPESRRMFITGLSSVETIKDAINRGAIHQYIAKPWNNDDLLLKIMAELEIYKNIQERKRLFNVTNKQNHRLFQLASNLKKQDASVRASLSEKKETLTLLKKQRIQAQKDAAHEAPYPGLDELLSRTITIDRPNLWDVFSRTRREVYLTMKSISDGNGFRLSPVETINKTREAYPLLNDDMFALIDTIIENAVHTIAPHIGAIGSAPAPPMAIDDYQTVPDFGTLAVNDGYITEGQLKTASAELKKKEAGGPSGQTIDKVLISRGFIERKNASRIFAKLTLIHTRLKDREFATTLKSRDLVTQKDVDQAFLNQLTTFEDSGTTILLGDLLVKSDIISIELSEEVMADLGRTEKNPTGSTSDSRFSPDSGQIADLVVSRDRLKAYIRLPVSTPGSEDITAIKHLIKKRGIRHGIVDDASLRHFMKTCSDPMEQFTVARGTPPQAGTSAQIVYHFNVAHETCGKILEDGSIDFHAMGDSPFVTKGQLVAEKKPMDTPQAGKDIFGEMLPVATVTDDNLIPGEGVEVSDDGLKLYATIRGHPIRDIKGAVSVMKLFTVRGDVDFSTGNIDYKGNVVVFGAIKPGFTVKCENLTVNEIDGAMVRISGDLNVSNGIINAEVETKGNIQARYINNSKIFCDKNIMITREIMGSSILISGELKNETGRITSSRIVARKGVRALQIGTEKALASKIKMGVDDHVKWATKRCDNNLGAIQMELDAAIQEKKTIDEESNRLHVEVANQTVAQEKITQNMDDIESKIKGIKKSKKMRLKLENDLKNLYTSLLQADERIKSIFKTQDTLLRKMETIDEAIREMNHRMAELQTEKEAIIDHLTQGDAVPLLKIGKRIYAGTKVESPQAALIVEKNLGTGKFMEVDTDDPKNPKKLIFQGS